MRMRMPFFLFFFIVIIIVIIIILRRFVVHRVHRRLQSIHIDYGFKLESLVTAHYFAKDKPVVCSTVSASGIVKIPVSYTHLTLPTIYSV